MNREKKIPKSFCYEPFLNEKDTISIENKFYFFAYKYEFFPFFDDITYHLSVEATSKFPWNNRKKAVDLLISKWKEDGLPQLERCYAHRKRSKARPLMIQYTTHYIQAMHWIDNEPIKSLENVEIYLQGKPFAPMNLADRLKFTCSFIDHYHAFSVLKLLYEESQKKWAIYLLDT